MTTSFGHIAATLFLILFFARIIDEFDFCAFRMVGVTIAISLTNQKWKCKSPVIDNYQSPQSRHIIRRAYAPLQDRFLYAM
jgi:hypothetical protein